MIVGKMADLAKYVGCHPGLDAAIQYALSLDFDQLPDGSDPGDGQYFHMNVFHTDIRGNPNWEMHRRYIDLQIILEGKKPLPGFPCPAWKNSPLMMRKGTSSFPLTQRRGFMPTERRHVWHLLPGGCPPPWHWKWQHPQSSPQGAGGSTPAKGSGIPFNHLGTARLETDRLILREYTMDDAGVMFLNWASDPEVAKTLMWDPHPDVDFTRKLLAQWIQAYQSGRSYHWVIEKNGEVIGDISLMTWSNRTQDGEIGYCLSKSLEPGHHDRGPDGGDAVPLC